MYYKSGNGPGAEKKSAEREMNASGPVENTEQSGLQKAIATTECAPVIAWFAKLAKSSIRFLHVYPSMQKCSMRRAVSLP